MGIVTSPPGQDDGRDLAAIGCTIRVTDTGTVTVQREHGCTFDNVRELCDAVARGELEVIDLAS